ncbi:Molybdenum cofactor biosynthesis protein MoaD [hydrothermal vent metagenome]|uniref:Molybdenum cofactor biosynthesis protein MoaD n=1 Tax=hydrothermal vent metagenome TaxID=652676 RepID=A0A3B1DXF5_9ZZZZ
MVRVEFLGPINKKTLNLDIDNLSQLSKLLQSDTTVSPWLEICAIAVNDILIQNIDYLLKDGDKVSLLPPVCGG